MITPVSEVPGPGSYESQDLERRDPCYGSVFKSKVTRNVNHKRYQSEAEELYRLKLRERMQKKIASSGELKKSTKNKVKTSFVSKVPRFITEVSPTTAGPGSYNLDDSHVNL